MSDVTRVLVTGATGKVGQTFLKKFFADERFAGAKARALCHNREVEVNDRLDMVKGSISDQSVVDEAMDGISHVVHLATCKETPGAVMDVTIKGLFWLLEAARQSSTFKRFILIGGDAGMGHFFYPHPVPITEKQRHSAYPGCYAFSKVMEEVMLEQYYIQYGLGGCCLMAPWIMEKDDFKYTLSFGDDAFGGPRGIDLVGAEKAAEYQAAGTVPVLCDDEGNPIHRGFVHVTDLIEAMLIALIHPAAHQQKFNICTNEPVQYREVADHLAKTQGLPSVDIKTPYKTTWLDNSKAKFLLSWRPQYDMKRIVDEAWAFERPADDPRKIWYPG
jgi:UDP-glucose 4-epimerase